MTGQGLWSRPRHCLLDPPISWRWWLGRKCWHQSMKPIRRILLGLPCKWTAGWDSWPWFRNILKGDLDIKKVKHEDCLNPAEHVAWHFAMVEGKCTHAATSNSLCCGPTTNFCRSWCKFIPRAHVLLCSTELTLIGDNPSLKCCVTYRSTNHPMF